MGKKKTKKEKIRYVDDGRSLADMSDVKGGMSSRLRGGTSSHFSDIWKTYWSAVRMMFKPMLVTIGFLTLAFLIITVFCLKHHLIIVTNGFFSCLIFQSFFLILTDNL